MDHHSVKKGQMLFLVFSNKIFWMICIKIIHCQIKRNYRLGTLTEWIGRHMPKNHYCEIRDNVLKLTVS